MTAFQAQDPQFEQRVRDSFARQQAMATIGALLARVEPGACDIELPFREDLILTPGRGDLVAKGRVLKPGRTLTVARAEVYSRDGRHVASMQQTLMMLPDTPDTKE